MISALMLLFLCFLGKSYSQNSLTGDGFGGRLWYIAHNYSVGAYSGFTICGSNNQLYGWGSNLFGELGIGTNTSTTAPVAALGMTDIKFYTTGYLTAAIKMDNTAWVWGRHLNINTGFTTTPVQVLDNVKFVDAGISHVVFVRYDSTVWAVGRNYRGELGNGSTSEIPITSPVRMQGINNAVRAAAIGCTGSIEASIILLADKTVKITGGGGWYQTTNSTTPVTIPGLTNIIDIKGNADGAYALSEDGIVYSFGRDVPGYYPVLGLGGNNNFVTPPTRVTFPAGAAPIVALSTNNDGYSVMALDSNHNVYGWGLNIHGQLGDGTLQNILTPKLIATDVVDIFMGESFSYILKSDNTLWATGKSGVNDYPTQMYGSIWMNLSNEQRTLFTQINPTIPPLNLCEPKQYGTVPIKLLNFFCTSSGNYANLFWTSAEEINFDKYEVQYSHDGLNFQSVVSIYAKGTNSTYSYVDKKIEGIAYYRLKMVDRDGSFEYSEIRRVQLNGKFEPIIVLPNPASQSISVIVKNRENIQSIQIISIEGKILKNIPYYYEGQRININHFSKGEYILKVIFKNNKIEYQRFQKT